MNQSLFLIAALAVAAASGAQTKKIQVSAYDEIAVSGSYTVELVEGNEGEITVSGEQKDLDNLSITSDGDNLVIKPEKWTRFGNSKTVKITVPVKDISEIALSGSGSITSKNTIKANRLEVALSGSGKVILDVETNEMEAAMSGSGRIELKGSSSKLASSISGSGRIAAFDCKTSEADVALQGSGECEVNCSESLTARISGSGRINYKGNPAKEDMKVSGSGRVTKS